jgi:hypothetical protein
MAFDLGESLDLLARTPAALDRLLRGTPASWHSIDEGPGTWSPIEVVGHLVHGEETDWVPRARIVMEHGPARPFDPFDREAMKKLYAGWTIEALLDRFAELRAANLATVRAWELDEARLDLPGRHPELGAVDLRQLLATWVAHDLDHVVQIARVMAKRYTDDVGPWRAYLGVLNR